MITAQILTPWTGNGSDNSPYRPLLLDLFDVQLYQDTPNSPARPPEPANLSVVAVTVTASPDVIAAIEAAKDENGQFIFWVIWSENDGE